MYECKADLMYKIKSLKFILSVFFFSSKCSLFHNANFFGSCIIRILYTGCAEIKKNNSGAKGLKLVEVKLREGGVCVCVCVCVFVWS